MPSPEDPRSLPTPALVERALAEGVERAELLDRQELLFELLRSRAARGRLEHSGILEILSDGFGFLRSEESGYAPGPADVYVSPSQIRKLRLLEGDELRGLVRAPKENERYLALVKVLEVNGRPAGSSPRPPLYSHHPRLGPAEPWPLERSGSDFGRLLGLLAPLGPGQRALVLAPPRSGTTSFLDALGRSLLALDPTLRVLALLPAARPEEIEASRARPWPTAGTAFDQPPQRNLQAASMLLARAVRLAERGERVLLLVDGLERLARAANEAAGRAPAEGLDPEALVLPRRLLAVAGRLGGAGSITVVASLATDTGSRLDASIAEALLGPENARIVLDRDLLRAGLPPMRPGECWSSLSVTQPQHRRELLAGLPPEPVGAVELLLRRISPAPPEPAPQA